MIQKIVSAILLSLVFMSPAVANDWLIGTWAAENKDIKEKYVFVDNSNVNLIGNSGKSTPATYTIEGSDVVVLVDLKVIAIKLYLQMSDNRRVLTLYSKEKPDTAVYRKVNGL